MNIVMLKNWGSCTDDTTRMMLSIHYELTKN